MEDPFGRALRSSFEAGQAENKTLCSVKLVIDMSGKRKD